MSAERRHVEGVPYVRVAIGETLQPDDVWWGRDGWKTADDTGFVGRTVDEACVPWYRRERIVSPPVIVPSARTAAREAAEKAKLDAIHTERDAVAARAALTQAVRDACRGWEAGKTEADWTTLEAALDAFEAGNALAPVRPRGAPDGIVLTIPGAPDCGCAQTPQGFVCARDRVARVQIPIPAANCRADAS